MEHACMVYTERAEMAAVSCGTSHASAVSTTLRWIFKNALYKASHSCRLTCERSESARERRIALYKSEPQQHQQHRLRTTDSNVGCLNPRPQLLCISKALWESGLQA